MGLQADRIERITRRFNADFREYCRLAVLFELETVGERLGDRLNGERSARITNLVDVAVVGGDADAEAVGIDARKLRDVIGDGTAGEFTMAHMQRFEIVEDG